MCHFHDPSPIPSDDDIDVSGPDGDSVISDPVQVPPFIEEVMDEGGGDSPQTPATPAVTLVELSGATHSRPTIQSA